jgi:hypothetical protein
VCITQHSTLAPPEVVIRFAVYRPRTPLRNAHFPHPLVRHTVACGSAPTHADRDQRTTCAGLYKPTGFTGDGRYIYSYQPADVSQAVRYLYYSAFYPGYWVLSTVCVCVGVGVCGCVCVWVCANSPYDTRPPIRFHRAWPGQWDSCGEWTNHGERLQPASSVSPSLRLS